MRLVYANPLLVIFLHSYANALLEQLAPGIYQESYDNAGLLVGNPSQIISGVLVTLDITEEVIDEAMAHHCNMIVAHHPIIFGGLKRLTGKNYVERTVLKAIKSDVALYATHTNLDNMSNGVNARICQQLGIEDYRILQPKKDTLQKIAVFVPKTHIEEVAQAMGKAGAGQIGNYSHCGFNQEGIGSFMPNDQANPYLGQSGQLEKVEEIKLEMVLPIDKTSKVLRAMQEAHPYEEVAYDIFALKNPNHTIGSGMIGQLPEAMGEMEFLKMVKAKMQTGCLKYTNLIGRPIKTVAVCGGAGSFLRHTAMAQRADVFITSDCKYHEFFDADGKIIMVDIGHYESEQYTINLLEEKVREAYPELKVFSSQVKTNPVNYL